MPRPRTRQPSDLIEVTSLATLFGTDTAWIAAWLGKIDVPVDAKGRVNRKKLVRALRRLARQAVTPKNVNAEVKAEMGNTTQSGLAWLEKELEHYGPKVIARGGRGKKRLTVQCPNGKNVWINVSVARGSKSGGAQVGFMVGPSEEGDIYDYFIFLSLASGRVWLRSRKDMLARWRAKHGSEDLGRMTVTLGPGSTADLIENRIGELL